MKDSVSDTGLNFISVTSLADRSEQAVAQQIEAAMVDPGYVVLRDFEFDLPTSSAFLLSLADRLGTAISHDENGSILWDIRAKEGLNQSVPTFSEHADEAFLHTDSQYRDAPEDIFALYCLSPADCGGGLSLLMTQADLLSEMQTTPERREALDALRTETFPFAVPTAFKRDPDGPEEFVHSPILEPGGKLRFRKDTLLSAVNRHPEMITPRARAAFDTLCAMLGSSDKIASFHLRPGDLFFLNNRTTLHGRTSFTDRKRHLLRIRVRT